MKLKTCLLLIFLTAGLYLVSNPRMAAKSLPVVTVASATDATVMRFWNSRHPLLPLPIGKA